MVTVRAAKGILAAATDHNYYCAERLEYLTVAGFEVVALAATFGLDADKVLELGPYQVPLVEGSWVMDKNVMEVEPVHYKHDARETPWPIADRRFDLFIALQVFEHLQPHVPKAFMEVRRIARHAIISLPIGWKVGDPLHRNITRDKALGWFAPVEPTRIVVGNEGKTRREIFVFEDLPRPEEK